MNSDATIVATYAGIKIRRSIYILIAQERCRSIIPWFIILAIAVVVDKDACTMLLSPATISKTHNALIFLFWSCKISYSHTRDHHQH